MAILDAVKEWLILIPPETPQAEKCAEDLSRYIGLLNAINGKNAANPPKIAIATHPDAWEENAFIILNCEDSCPERNGFEWRAEPERVEIYGESYRGLCNGVYSFLAALGIRWPSPGLEKIPPLGFSPASASACEPSHFNGENPAAAPWLRFVPAGKTEIKKILKNSKDFAAWAARNRYDAIILPLWTFASGKTGQKIMRLKEFLTAYGIAIEAGGHDLSSLVPRKHFIFHRDFFRMEGGKRKKEHHFCPTNPGTIALAGKEGNRLFHAAQDIKTFHLWPDEGFETAWCSCPTCRAFTALEQNRIAVNIAADVLAKMHPDAFISFLEKSGEDGNPPGNIHLRKNTFITEILPTENKSRIRNA